MEDEEVAKLARRPLVINGRKFDALSAFIFCEWGSAAAAPLLLEKTTNKNKTGFCCGFTAETKSDCDHSRVRKEVESKESKKLSIKKSQLKSQSIKKKSQSRLITDSLALQSILRRTNYQPSTTNRSASLQRLHSCQRTPC